MNVSFPVGKSMIESALPSVDRDFVDVMYCVEVPERSPIVTFETTVRSSAASGSARAAATANASMGRPGRIIGKPPFFEERRAYHRARDRRAGQSRLVDR